MNSENKPATQAEDTTAGVGLKIEAGKCYRTRVGGKVGPIAPAPNLWSNKYPWIVEGSPSRGTWRENGRFLSDRETSSFDLVAEWVDEPVTPETSAPVDFIEGDVVAVRGTIKAVYDLAGAKAYGVQIGPTFALVSTGDVLRKAGE